MYKPTTSCGQVGLVLHKIYQQYIKYKTNGVFVEVGSNDGKIGSFTYNLANLGWRGIYCEPITEIYNLCVENHKTHKNVTCLNVGCGSKKEELEITVAMAAVMIIILMITVAVLLVIMLFVIVIVILIIRVVVF